jgi:carboxylesterase
MVRLISIFVRYRPKSGEDWFDQAAYAEHVSYPENPVRSGAEFYSLVAEMQAALPNVNVPVLLLHSKNDTSIPPESVEHIFAALGTSDKTKLYITGAGHVVTRDAARDEVFEAAANFIHRIEPTR